MLTAQQNPLLHDTIRLWVASRFIEGKWKCWGDPVISAANPKNPHRPHDDWESLPPYLDYQVASVIIQRVLVPLGKKVLQGLQEVVNEHKPEDWYITFLISFILLNNYELQMKFQRQFAARRKSPVLFPFRHGGDHVYLGLH